MAQQSREVYDSEDKVPSLDKSSVTGAKTPPEFS